MTQSSQRFIVRWPLAILLGLVCSFQAAAHGYDGYDGWRPHHHHEYYQGWQRPYYPPVYAPVPPPRYVPVPPVVIAAPPLRYEVPGWRPPHYREEGWR